MDRPYKWSKPLQRSNMRYRSSRLAFAVVILIAVPFVAIGQTPVTFNPVTFNKDVLPILQKNCQVCHRPGQIAPMALLTYKDARPWAKAIKNAVATRTMPPWFADPNYGHFPNERRLKQAEIDTIAKWADAGSPEGDAKDAPPPVQWPEDGWQIKPDYVVEGPTYDVPAKGIVEWTWFVVPGGFTKDTWVTSIEVLPSQLAVTHHVCLSYIQHTPEVPYYTAMLPRGVIQRDAEGNEIRSRPAQPGAAAQGGGAFPGIIGVIF